MNHSSLSTIISPKRAFFIGVLGFFLAISLVNYFEFASLFLLPLVLLVGFQIFLRFKNIKWFLLCFFIGLSFGYIRATLEIKEIQANFVLLQKTTHNYQERVFLSGDVGSLMKIDDISKTYLFHATSIEKRPLVGGNIFFLLKSPLNSFIKEGDEISYNSMLSPIRSDKNFSFDKYYLSKDIYGTSTESSLVILDNHLSWYERQILFLRDSFSSHIHDLYPPDSADFLGGLLFGERQNLDKKIVDDFKLSGLSHIIAVSGFNITILIVFCTFLFRFLPVWIRVSIITLVVCLFLSLVGEQVSALRAGIMGLAGYYAVSFGRRVDVFYLLLGTAVFFVILHPYTLNYDVSFHLSFLAVLGMIYTTPFFNKIFVRLPGVFGIKEALVATLGALSFTFPISLLNFGQLPLLTPISNILVTPLIPITMLLGFVSIVFDMLNHTLGVVIGFFGWGFLSYMLLIASFFGSLKETILQLNLSEYGFLILSGYYICLVYLLVHPKVPSYTSSSEVHSSRILSGERINDA